LSSASRSIDRRIRKDGGTPPADWQPHDIRRTVRTGLARAGVRRDIAERILNHVSERTVLDRNYDHYSYRDEMIDGVKKWETLLLSIVGDVTPPQELRELPGHRGLVLDVFKTPNTTVTMPEIVAATGLQEASIRAAIHNLIREGKLIRVNGGQRHGKY